MKPRIHTIIVGMGVAFAAVEHRMRQRIQDLPLVHVNIEENQEVKKSKLQEAFDNMPKMEIKYHRKHELAEVELKDNPLLFGTNNFIERKTLPRRKKY